MAKKIKKVRGVEVQIEEKGPVVEEKATGDEGGMVDTSDLFKWLCSAYPENQPVDRKGGRVWHLDGKKVVKDPCLENKGGVFFGKHLNDALLEATKEVDFYRRAALTGHMRGNMKIVSGRIHVDLLEAVKTAIKSVHVPMHEKLQHKA